MKAPFEGAKLPFSKNKIGVQIAMLAVGVEDLDNFRAIIHRVSKKFYFAFVE